MKGIEDMKRYDEIVRVINKNSGLVQVVRGWDAEEMKYFFSNQDKYDIGVECRDCGNIHKINTDCQVCDLPTKIKPEYLTLLKG
jgi:hypothetical protein